MATPLSDLDLPDLTITEAPDLSHEELYALSPEIYVALASLPGATDHTRLMAAGTVLSRTARVPVEHLVAALPPQRMLRLFLELRRQRVNNARSSSPRQRARCTSLAARSVLAVSAVA